MNKFIFGILLCLPTLSHAEQVEVLMVDRVVSTNLELAFPNEKNIKPRASDFKLINYIIMSNEMGERWAVATLKNTSTGGRILEKEHLIALFADGKRKEPLTFKLSFEPQEVQSVTITFGQSKFPILSLKSSH